MKEGGKNIFFPPSEFGSAAYEKIATAFHSSG